MSKKYITPKIMVKRIDSLHLMASSPGNENETKLKLEGGTMEPTLKTTQNRMTTCAQRNMIYGSNMND